MVRRDLEAQTDSCCTRLAHPGKVVVEALVVVLNDFLDAKVRSIT